MHPRQRSKCVVTVSLSATVPSRRASIRWMRPRGESISSLQSTKVGQVGRQKPQWTQSAVSSRITRRERRSGRARAGCARRGRRPHFVALSHLAAPSPCRRRLLRGGRRLRRAQRALRRAGPGRSARVRARRLVARATAPTRRRRLRRRRRESPQPRSAPRPREAIPRTGRGCLPGGGRRARSVAAGSEGAGRRGQRASSVSTARVRAAFGRGCRRKLARTISASLPSEPQTRRARS